MPQKYLSQQQAIDYLQHGNTGRLATCSSEGQPYITPLHYVYQDEKLYFHCAHEGQKLMNIASNEKICFEVSHTEKNVFGAKACACATRYTSVLVFGTARIVSDAAEKVMALNRLTAHIAGDSSYAHVTEELAAACCVLVVDIVSISGKENVDP